MSDMPTWEEFMIPILRVLSDGQTRSRREIRPLVANEARLTEEQRDETLASGQPTHENRIGWGISFLANIGALGRPMRAHYVITDAGRQLLVQFPDKIRERDLVALGADPNSPIRTYVSTVRRSSAAATPDRQAAEEAAMTPIEQVEDGVRRIHDEVSAELLSRLQGKDPAFFENAVVELLLAMGYGGTGGSGSVTQLSNDGGIDGVIDQDVLGLSRVYIQAKRYADGNTVGRPDIQGFVGALHGRADSGVFISTSRFSTGAN